MAQLDCKNRNSSTGIDAAFSADDIRRQFQRILKNPDFAATRQQRAFFIFVVEQTLTGNSQNIKGYTVATQVFGRDENFDQSTDPIVSIQANKLRRALERYYLLSGKEDEILVEIPRGTYVPIFRQQEPILVSPAQRRSIDKDNWLEGALPTILIKPFQNLTDQPEKDYWGAGFAAELANEINRCKWISVLQYSPEGTCRRSSDTGARFIIDGSIRKDEDEIKVVVSLIDTKLNQHIWGDSQRLENGLTRIIAFQEKVAQVVGAKVAGEQGIITKTLFSETMGKHPGQLNTYEAILYYHHFDQTLAPEDFVKALEALEKARHNEPESGQVWSFLARLYANIYSLEIPGFDIKESGAKALEYAEKGARLDPEDQGARLILALIRLFSDDLVSASKDVNLAYALNPNSLFLMDGIGYLKTLLGEWSQGPALIRKVISLNPYYKSVIHYALWLDYLRQHDFKKAYLETTELRRPAVFWYPLAKATSLGLLGRIEDGKRFADDLLQLKPDFREGGRRLIGRYIKFDDIADLVIEGLNKVGITVD